MKHWAFVAAFCAAGTAFGQSGGNAGLPAATPAQSTPAPKPVVARVGIGDAAPVLGINAWVKGTPVGEYVKGRVYVVEFWAMGVPVCRQSGPLLGELQTVFKDKGLTVVGVSVMDRGGAEEVEKFVKGAGSGGALTQSIGYDATGDAAKRFMQPTGQNSIPVVFVIDKEGRLAWIGHPLDGLDRVVDQVIAGKWDLAKAKQEAARRVAAEERSRVLVSRLEEEFGANQTDKALGTMDELAGIDPPLTGEWIVSKFGYLLLERKDVDKAYAYAASAMAGAGRDDAPSLKAMAWMTLAEPGVARRDVELAKKMAARADEITRHADPNVLDTLARAMFESGDVAGAIEAQKRAAEGCILPTQRKEMDERVRRYVAAKK